MFHSAHEWSVFCALDGIHPAEAGKLGDYSFVTRVTDRRRSRLAQLPFTGQAWHHRVAVEFLLHHGICDWSCISHSFTATGRLSERRCRGWSKPGRLVASMQSCLSTR